jgi:methionyl-tRNA formyltransferase
MKLGVLTAMETRHRFVAATLAAEFDTAAVGYVEVGYTPAKLTTTDLTDDEARIVAAHFAERARQEERFFGHRAAFLASGPSLAVERIRAGELNTSRTAAFLRDAGVDTVLVYGTDLIKPPLLDAWPERMINLHLGLSPYYRGTATNFYPLLNEEPEYVGATIHLIDAGIDDGPIFRHARPEITIDDQPHTIGCKAILAGVRALIGVLRDVDRKTARPVPQWKADSARLYRRKEYHPRQVVDLYRKLRKGLIPAYVARAASVRNRMRLLE